MKAVVATGRGTEEDLSKIKVVTDRSVPNPGWGEIRIRVAASSVNPVDWKLYSQGVMTVMTLLGPKVLGFDVSGVVDAVGWGVSRLKVGDAVWADLGTFSLTGGGVALGAWAEYAVISESQVGLKPAGLSFTDAAVLPLVGLTDIQALRKAGVPGRKNFSAVVVNGAGGTGVPAIQMLQLYGATKIATSSSPSNFELLKGLGATDVVDYHTTSLWDVLPENSVDVVYDNMGQSGTADAAMRVLRAGGAYLMLPGGHGGALSKNPKAGVQQVDLGLTDASKYQDLDALKALVDAGLKPLIRKSFTLDTIQEAIQEEMHGHGVGKVGLNISALSQQVIV